MFQVCPQTVTIPTKPPLAIVEQYLASPDQAHAAVYFWLLKNVLLCVQGEFQGIA